MRTLYSLSVRKHGDFTVLDVRGNAFLHHMVRNIAGVLMAIGLHQQPETWAQAVLESRSRAKGGILPPPGSISVFRRQNDERFFLPPM